MNEPATPLFGNDSYDDVERAVMETARGRWFLAEFARRNRAGDTQAILAAIDRLDRRLGGEAAAVAAPPAAQEAVAGNDAPIDTLMARLAAALEDTNRTMQQAEQAKDPATFEAIDALSPQDRLRLFY